MENENENQNEHLKSGCGSGSQNQCKGPSSSCAIEKNLDQRVSDPNFPKKIGSDSLSTETILEAIDNSYKEKAASLVQNLKSNNQFTWDENGIVSISNRRIPGANILDIVPNILYKKEGKKAPQEVFGFIEKAFPQLYPHSETENHWWYLGPVD